MQAYQKIVRRQIPHNSLVEKYKVAMARLYLTLLDSENEASKDGKEIIRGRKWPITEAVEQFESSLQH